MNSNLSNHILISLQLEGDTTVTNFPFKFNQDWLKDPSFCSMVRDVQTYMPMDASLNPMEKLVRRLKKLKLEVKDWIKMKATEHKKDLILIESQILEIL